MKVIMIMTMFHVVIIKRNNALPCPLMSVIFCDFGKLAFTLLKYQLTKSTLSSDVACFLVIGPDQNLKT